MVLAVAVDVAGIPVRQTRIPVEVAVRGSYAREVKSSAERSKAKRSESERTDASEK